MVRRRKEINGSETQMTALSELTDSTSSTRRISRQAMHPGNTLCGQIWFTVTEMLWTNGPQLDYSTSHLVDYLWQAGILVGTYILKRTRIFNSQLEFSWRTIQLNQEQMAGLTIHLQVGRYSDRTMKSTGSCLILVSVNHRGHLDKSESLPSILPSALFQFIALLRQLWQP